MTTAAILLAAGASTRFGQPKQLLPLDGETLLNRAIRISCEAGCAPILVILGASHEQVASRSTFEGVTPIVNPNWQEGMASSIRLAVQSLPQNLRGTVLMVCDQPAVTPKHLAAIMAASEITASSYAGHNGVPAFFPAPTFPQLLTLRGDAGARSLLQRASAIPLRNGELDIDTPADLARALQILHSEAAP